MIPDDLQEQARLFKLNRATAATKQRRVTVDNNVYAKFRAKYRNNMVACIHDMFAWKEGQKPTDYQDEIIYDLFTHGRMAVRGCHGLGKTMLVSTVVLAFALTRDIDSDWKIPTTASVWRQLTKYLWPEIHKWSKLIRWDFVGRDPFDRRIELQTLNLKLNTGEAFAVASNDPGHIEGAHADSLLYVFDESKMIPAGTFDAAEGAFSGAGTDTVNEAFAITVSTPGETSGRFYDIATHRPGFSDWRTRHVTLEEAIAAGRLSREWAEKRKAQWGEKSAIYQNRVLGEFADSSEDALIPLAWIEQSQKLFDEYEGLPQEGATTSYGLDVAWRGADQSAFAKITGDVLEWLRYYAKLEPMELVGHVAAEVADDRESPVGVDVVGMGAGYFGRLEELGYAAVAVDVRETTEIRDMSGLRRFHRVRDLIWWMLRDALDPDNPERLALPSEGIEDLVSDMTAPMWSYNSSGKVIVEDKDSIKTRLGRSPDGAEAVAIALYVRAVRIMSFVG